MAIRGINTRVEVQSTLGSAKTISAITKANPGVASSTAHGFSNGDVVVLAVEGMGELNGVACRVSSVATNEFTLEGIDTSGYGTFTSGTATEATAFDTFASLQNISLPNQEANKLDITTIHDTQGQETLGLAGAVSGTMSGLFSPTETAVTNLRNATRASAPRAFRITFETGAVAVFNADVSAGQGFDIQQNSIATASYSLTIKRFINFYAS
jgi:Phage tail tube protein, TTP/Ubiquitin-activating enzyme E1 FCCH domain